MGFLADFKTWLDTVLLNNPGTLLRGNVLNAGLDTNLADKLVWLDQGLISAGTSIALDNPIGRVYPAWTAAGLTGNITFSPTNAVVGGRAYVKHSDSTAFADPAEVLNPAALNYTEGVDNYFEFVCVSISPLRVWATKKNPAYAAAVHNHSRIQDADNDTHIDVESSADNDQVRLFSQGIERLRATSTALFLGNVSGAPLISLLSSGAINIIHSLLLTIGNTSQAWMTYGTSAIEGLVTGRTVFRLQNGVQEIGDMGGAGNDTLVKIDDTNEEITIQAPTISLPRYTALRDDGPTTRALYTNADGDLMVGTVTGVGGANAYHQDAVADVTTLKAVNTTSGTDYPSGAERTVITEGEYWLNRASVAAEALPNIVGPNTGPGMWFKRTGLGVTGMPNFGDLADVSITSPVVGHVPKWDGSVWANAAEIGGGSAYWRDGLANIAALQALVSTGIPDLAVVFVAGEGSFVKDPTELGPQDLAAGIVEDASGNFWTQFTGSETEEVGDTYNTIWLDASFFGPSQTNPATLVETVYAGVEKKVAHWSFSTGTEQGIEAAIAIPEDYDVGTAIKAKFFWGSASGGSGTAVFGIKAVALGDGESYGTAWGTEVTLTDTLGTVGNNHISPATAAITIGSAPEAGHLAVFKVVVKTGSTLGANVLFRGANVQYKQSATPVAQW